jgi:hypothetical protein
MTLQQQYNLIKEGKGNKTQFLKQARSLFPEYFNQYTDFDTASNVLKSKQIISEAAGGVVGKGFNIWDWKKILEEEVKAEEKETSKEVKDANANAFDNSDMKNADNVNFNEIMKGFYAELKDEKNADKTGDELKAMVVKNLAKDCLYYTKNGEFGTKGVGYTTEAPGLGTPKEPKGKHKSSGYGDIEKEVKVKANVQDSLGDKEAKTSMPKKVKEMPDKGVTGTEKKMKLQENTDPNKFELGQENPDDAPMGVNDKAASKPMKAKVDIKSTLEKIATAVFTEKDLNKAKALFKSHIEASGINEKDKVTILKNIEATKTKPRLDSYLVNSLLHYEGMGTSQLKENTEIDPTYTHFAIRKSDNKVVNGWEYKNLDNESIKEYCKMDLKDQFPDSKVSEFTIVTKRGAESKGIDPFDSENWYKMDESIDPQGAAGDEEKEKEAKDTQVKKPNPNVSTNEQTLRSIIHNLIKEEMDWDRFTIQVLSNNYEGTIKRDEEGWMMYDEDNQPEESGPFNSLKSLMSYYNLTKEDLHGTYVTKLKGL